MHAIVDRRSLCTGSRVLTSLAESYVRQYSAPPWNETELTVPRAVKHLGRLIHLWGGAVFANEGKAFQEYALVVLLSQDNPIFHGLEPFGAQLGDAYLSEWVHAETTLSVTDLLEAIAETLNPQRLFARLIPTAPEIPMLEEQGFESRGTYTHHSREWVVLCRHRKV